LSARALIFIPGPDEGSGVENGPGSANE